MNLEFYASGNTPLHLAVESGHADAAILLIEAGADRTRVSTIVKMKLRRFLMGILMSGRRTRKT